MWDKIYKRQLLVENNIYFPENVAYEDIFFSGLYYLYAKKVAIINYELYHYFVNNGSTVLKKNACQNVYIPEKYRILLPLLNAKVSEDELDKIANSFKANY